MTRRNLWIAVGTVVLIAVAVAILAARRPRSGPATTTAAGSGSMAGMNMSTDGSARLTSSQIREFGITYGTVDARELTAATRTTGIVTVDERRIVQVTPKFGGFVERLYVNATGQPVQRGHPLLDVFSPELLAAQQELLLAGRLQREVGRSSVPGVPGTTSDLVEAAKRRLRLWDISEAQIDEVIRSGQPRRTLTLYAPASGVVMAKQVVEGQSIMSGQLLYTIANLSVLWIDIQLRETDAGSVRVGTAADIQITGLPGRPYKARIGFIYPTVDSVSRSIRARVEVANVGESLKPGMYATIQLTTPGRRALTVPNSAILKTGERTIVFVDMGGGVLMPHDVEIGAVASDYTEILSGLEPGQKVVTSAQFLLDSESNLAEVMRSMIGLMSSGGKSQGQSMQNMPGMSRPARVVPTPPPTKR